MNSGSRDRPTLELDEDALATAAHRLSLTMGVSVPLWDYSESVGVLFSELRKNGWAFARPEPRTRCANTKACQKQTQKIPLAALKAQRQRAKSDGREAQ